MSDSAPRWRFEDLVEAWRAVGARNEGAIAALAEALAIDPRHVVPARDDTQAFADDSRIAVAATVRAHVRDAEARSPVAGPAANLQRLQAAILVALDSMPSPSFAAAFGALAAGLLAERPRLESLRGRARLIEELRRDLLREPRLPLPEGLGELLEEASDVGPASPPIRGLETPLSPGRDDLLRALREVYDPELGLDVVSLGLVYDARVESGTARVTMTLTSAACPLGDLIRRDAEWRLRGVPGVRAASVEIVFDPPWTPDRMAEGARAALGLDPSRAGSLSR